MRPVAREMNERSTIPKLRFQEGTPDLWKDFEALFEGKGGPKNCWCMVWRTLPSKSRRNKAAKKQAIKDRIMEGQPVGLLGYRGTEPVAWCSVAPRGTFRDLGGLRDDGIVVWSLVCMFVKPELRGLGISKQLILAALELARRHGAAVLEAYPVDPESPSYRFMGFVPVFKELGFKEVGKAGSRRHVMRMDLR